jgi:hypothetical protein
MDLGHITNNLYNNHNLKEDYIKPEKSLIYYKLNKGRYINGKIVSMK